MQSKFVALVLLICAVLAFATPFVVDAVAAAGPAALPSFSHVAGERQNSGEVNDPVQLYLIGTIASGFVYMLKLLAKKYPNWVIRRDWLTAALYMISLGLAFLWSGVFLPGFPAFSDPVTFVAAVFKFISDLLVVLAVPVSFATLIYNVLLKRVFDAWAGANKAI